jgi:hypothetical protein
MFFMAWFGALYIRFDHSDFSVTLIWQLNVPNVGHPFADQSPPYKAKFQHH